MIFRLYKKQSGNKLLVCVIYILLLNSIFLFSSTSLAVDQPLLVTVEDSMKKYRRDQPITAAINPTISLASARNEAETTQILIYAPNGASNLSVNLTALTNSGGNSISTNDSRVFITHYANIAMPTQENGIAGEWPDGLVPLKNSFNIPTGRQQSIWLKFTINQNVKPGLYRGAANIQQGSKIISSIPITMDVWNITLSDQVHLPAIIGLDYEPIKKFESPQLSDSQFGNTIVPGYYQILSQNRVFPIMLYKSQPTYAIKSGQSEINFDPYIQQLSVAYKNKGPVMIPFSLNWPVDSNTYPLFSDKYNQLAVDYLRKVATFFADKGIIDQAYIYLGEIDEPKTIEQYTLVEGFSEILKVADPRLKLLLTIHSECFTCANKKFNSLDKDNILWAPNITFYDNKALKLSNELFGLVTKASAVPSGWDSTFTNKLQGRGRQLWWYLNPWTFVTRDPIYKYPNLYIDHQGIEQRIIGWMAFKYGINGIGFWNATYWRFIANPWQEVPRGEEGSSIAGDGSLLYPANGSAVFTGQPQPNEPISTIRLELWRESSEDYELLYLLAQKGKVGQAQTFAGQASTTLQNYEVDPEKLQSLRKQVANAIIQP